MSQTKSWHFTWVLVRLGRLMSMIESIFVTRHVDCYRSLVINVVFACVSVTELKYPRPLRAQLTTNAQSKLSNCWIESHYYSQLALYQHFFCCLHILRLQTCIDIDFVLGFFPPINGIVNGAWNIDSKNNMKRERESERASKKNEHRLNNEHIKECMKITRSEENCADFFSSNKNWARSRRPRINCKHKWINCF